MPEKYSLEFFDKTDDYDNIISKGWGKNNEDFQKTEMALEGEPFVLEGCPFHSL